MTTSIAGDWPKLQGSRWEPCPFGQEQRDHAMATTVPSPVLGSPAPRFRLPATNGNTYTLEDIAGSKGTVIVFICNHCPYVKAVIDRLVKDAKVLMAESIGVVAICSNDAEKYPEDSFDNMRHFAEMHDFP